MIGRFFRRFWVNQLLRSDKNQNIWWTFVDWGEVSPQTWFVNGEIIEA